MDTIVIINELRRIEDMVAVFAAMSIINTIVQAIEAVMLVRISSELHKHNYNSAQYNEIIKDHLKQQT